MEPCKGPITGIVALMGMGCFCRCFGSLAPTALLPRLRTGVHSASFRDQLMLEASATEQRFCGGRNSAVRADPNLQTASLEALSA